MTEFNGSQVRNQLSLVPDLSRTSLKFEFFTTDEIDTTTSDDGLCEKNSGSVHGQNIVTVIDPRFRHSMKDVFLNGSDGMNADTVGVNHVNCHWQYRCDVRMYVCASLSICRIIQTLLIHVR